MTLTSMVKAFQQDAGKPVRKPSGTTDSWLRRERYQRCVSGLALPLAPETRRLIQRICFKHNMAWDAVISHRRAQHFVRARQEICWSLAVSRHNLSYPRMGKLMNRDHSTIMHSVKVFQILLEDGVVTCLPEFSAAMGQAMFRGETPRVVARGWEWNAARNAEIRADKKAGVSTKALADKHGIALSTVQHILQGRAV